MQEGIPGTGLCFVRSEELWGNPLSPKSLISYWQEKNQCIQNPHSFHFTV